MDTRENGEFKISKASDMIVAAAPALSRRPGEFIRDVVLPEYGLTTADAARRMGVDRAGFHKTLAGRQDVSRDLAYKLGALTRDEVADLLIAYQHAWDLEHERDRRESFKATIERVAARQLPC